MSSARNWCFTCLPTPSGRRQSQGQAWGRVCLLFCCMWLSSSARGQSTPVASNTTLNIISGMSATINLYQNTAWTGMTWQLHYTTNCLPQHGTVLFPGGTATTYYCSYQAASNYSGNDTFTWSAFYGTNVSNVATCSIFVTTNVLVAFPGTNTVTTGISSYIYLYQSLIYTGSVYALKYTADSLPQHGTLLFPGAPGSTYYCTYQATNSYSGSDSFSWHACNSNQTSAVVTCSLTVVPNVITIQPFTNTAASGMLTNFSAAPHISGVGASCCIQSQPASGGTAYVVSPTTMYYQSAPGFVGTDTFLWAATDGITTTTPAQATLLVSPSLPQPAAQTVVVASNSTTLLTPLYYGGGGYTCWLVRATSPAHGTVLTNGAWRYTPGINYVGADSFTWSVAYSNATTAATNTTNVTLSIVVKAAGTNADWMQWRFDECRTAQTPMILPGTLFLQWRRDVPACGATFSGAQTVQGVAVGLDYCKPVQLGKQLFVSLMANDSVTAYNTDTGAQQWRYYASGALRRPPLAMALGGGTNVVIFGSDDGYVYCLNAADGSERWRFQAAPNTKKAMGYKRLGSMWPVWSSPVAYSNNVYFAAGHLPSWGMFVYCLNAVSGTVVWCNDGRLRTTSSTYAGLGPLSLSADHTSIYSSALGLSSPWVIRATTGEWKSDNGSVPPGRVNNDYWYVDGSGQNANVEPISLLAGAQTITPATVASLPGFAGTVGSLLAGDNKLFVATTTGSIYCYGGSNATAMIYTNAYTPLPVTTDAWTTVVQTMLSGRPDLAQGLALIWGVGSGRLVTELAQQATNLMIVATDPDTNKLYNLRVAMDAAGWSGARVATMRGNPMDAGFAPYQATLIASEDVTVAGYPSAGTGQDSNGIAMVQLLYKCTRPFGGEIWLPTLNAQDAAINNWLTAANLPTCNSGASYQTYRPIINGLGADGITRIKRTGFPDNQQIPKPPFRAIVFGVTDADPNWHYPTLNPNPTFTNGWSRPANPGVPNPLRGAKGGYDLYSWLPAPTNDPTSYEPPVPAASNVQAAAISSVFNVLRNPLYNRPEPAPDINMTGGCFGNDQYGALYARPNKPGYVANLSSQYWGVAFLPEIGGCDGSGARCFAWDGMLVMAADASGCGCCHDLEFTQIGLVSDDAPNTEMWVSYQNGLSKHPIQEKTILQAGINFGATMDRYDPVLQLLWTHHPTSGYGLMSNSGATLEATPLIPVSYRGNPRCVYHSCAPLAPTNSARGWISPSQIVGMSGLTIPLAQPLVALPGTPTLPLNGTLDDSCWTNPLSRINLSLPGSLPGLTNSCLDGGYMMLRYDATNLYIAGGTHLADTSYGAGSIHYMMIGLGSRDQQTPPITLYYANYKINWNDPSNTILRQSQGIPTNAWQAASWLPASPYTGEVFQAEFAIPWSSLAAAGLWTNQLVVNANINGAVLDGYSAWAQWSLPAMSSFASYSPLYLDAARGPVTNIQAHTVQLYFMEMEGKTNGQRVFDVKLQGNTVLSSFDVVAAAGGPRQETVQTFSNILFADHLDIDFIPHAGEPILNSLAIIATNATIPANQPPVALLHPSSTNGAAPLLVTLNAQQSYDPDGQIIECAWDTGDGRLSRGSQINHVFAEPGTYQVNLLVMDNRGATAATSTTVTVYAGVPAAFICNIRSNGASGCDYTNLSTWSTALASDLTSSTTVFQISSTGTWVAADNGKVVTFTGGNTGVLYWVANPLATQWMAAVVNVGGTGTVTVGTVTIAGGHLFTNIDSGSSAPSLLFSVSSYGTYVASNDDNRIVTFPGGAWGTLKHINHDNLACVANCCGVAIQTGTVTCASGHTFTITSSGNPIYTAVAECYNDWTNGLPGNTTLANWFTDANHCLSIRPGAGQGHSGKLKNANGSYTGFTLKGTLSTTAVPHTRLANLIDDGAVVTVGSGGAVNRVLASVTAGGSTVLIANSIGSTFSSGGQINVSFYNCTAGSFLLGSSFASQVRAVNCLSYSNSTGYFSTNVTGAFWLSHNVSVDTTATNYDTWQDGNEKNQAGQGVTFVSATSNDYHLAASDNCARGQGQPGLGTDIDGDPRTGPWYDVGADQNSAPLNFALTIANAGNGKSSLTNGPYATVPVPAGTSTQIIYTANDWYRINTLAANSTLLADAAGASAYTQTIPAISANVSNTVSFAMATPAQTGFTNVPTTWLMNWPAASICTGLDAYSIADKYQLGLSPTASNTYILAMDTLTVSSNLVVAVVKRTVTGALSPDGMHGQLILQASDTPQTSGFTNILTTAVTGATVFDGTGRRAYTNAVDGSAKYYKAAIN